MNQNEIEIRKIPFIIIVFFFFCLLIFQKNIYFYTGFSFSDISIICIIGTIVFVIVKVSQLSKYKVLLRLLSIYILLHFIIFPVIYVFLITSNSKSFDIDTSITNNEKEIFSGEINDNYSPKLTSKLIQITNQIYKDSCSLLDKNISYLEEGNIIVLNEYLITLTTISCDDSHPRTCTLLNICDISGKAVIQNKHDNNMLVGSFGGSVRDLVLKISRESVNKIQDFKKEKEKLKTNNKIWSYSRILPYSLNIYTTGNLQPKTKLSNIIFHIHQFILSVGIIGLIVNLSSTYLSTHKQED